MYVAHPITSRKAHQFNLMLGNKKKRHLDELYLYLLINGTKLSTNEGNILQRESSYPALTAEFSDQYDSIPSRYPHDFSCLSKTLQAKARNRSSPLSMITVQHITKRYGNHVAIEDVTFDVKQGEILGFLGPNGAGKTTTMRIITCFMPPSEGTVTVAGFDSFDHPQEIKQRIGYLPEFPPLYQELTVSEYLRFVGRLKRLPSSRLPGRMAHVVEELGLGEVRHRVIGHLSKGFRQRVGLAQALIHDPPVLILDEPTVGLDPKQIIEIRELIRGLAGSHTLILSTHILSEATAICDRVVIIDHGKVVAEDTPAQLASRLRQSEKLSLTVKHPPQHWAEQLASLPGVLHVVPGAVPETTILECELGRDIREDISQFVVRQGVGLLELKPLSLSLEDVFIQLTQQDQPLNPTPISSSSPSTSSPWEERSQA